MDLLDSLLVREHPAAMLFGSPVAGGGVGIDNLAFLSWFNAAGGKELYEQLWDEMGRDIKGFMLQPVGCQKHWGGLKNQSQVWRILENIVLEHLQEYLVKHTKILVLLLQ